MATILVVDDDDAIRLVLRIELVAEGHEVVEAGDGREALARLDEWHPDVVLLDLMMPVMDGWEVLHALEAMTDRPPVLGDLRARRARAVSTSARRCASARSTTSPSRSSPRSSSTSSTRC